MWILIWESHLNHSSCRSFSCQMIKSLLCFAQRLVIRIKWNYPSQQPFPLGRAHFFLMPPALGKAPGPLLGAVPPVCGAQLQRRLSWEQKHSLPSLGAYSFLDTALAFYTHDLMFLTTAIWGRCFFFFFKVFQKTKTERGEVTWPGSETAK